MYDPSKADYFLQYTDGLGTVNHINYNIAFLNRNGANNRDVGCVLRARTKGAGCKTRP